MAKTKALAKPPAKGSPAVESKPEAAHQPIRRATASRELAKSLLPPPKGQPAPQRAAKLLRFPGGPPDTPTRARMSTGLQKVVGNARLQRMIAQPASRGRSPAVSEAAGGGDASPAQPDKIQPAIAETGIGLAGTEEPGGDEGGGDSPPLSRAVQRQGGRDSVDGAEVHDPALETRITSPTGGRSLPEGARSSMEPPPRKLSWWQRAKRWAFEKAISLAGVKPKVVMGFIRQAGGLFMHIILNFDSFVGTLIKAVAQGFRQFWKNIKKYLLAGLAGFLFGSLLKAGIEAPRDLSGKSILKLVLQVLGITPERFRERLAKRIGEKNVARLERAWGFLSKLFGGGFKGFATSLGAYLGNLKQMVIDTVKTWIITKIVQAAILKIASLFNPVSGLVSLLKSLYNVVQFLRERAGQVAALFQAVVATVAPLARGDTKKAANRVEQGLAVAVPVTLGFLAGFLGLGNIGKFIKNTLKKFAGWVDKGIKKVVELAVKAWRKLFGRDKTPNKRLKDPKLEKQRQLKAERDVVSSVDSLKGPKKRILGKERKAVTRQQVIMLLAKKKSQHKFTKLTLTTPEGRQKIRIKAGFSPPHNLNSPGASLVVGGPAPALAIGDPVSYKRGKSWEKGLISEPPGKSIEISSWGQSRQTVVTQADYSILWRLPHTAEERQFASDWRAIYSVNRSTWNAYPDARKILNFRFHKFKNNWGGKSWNWHHIHEHTNGGPNSVENLGFIAAFWNDRLNHHFRRTWPRRGLLSGTGQLTLRQYLARQSSSSPLHRGWGLEMLEFLHLKIIPKSNARGRYQQIE